MEVAGGAAAGDCAAAHRCAALPVGADPAAHPVLEEAALELELVLRLAAAAADRRAVQKVEEGHARPDQDVVAEMPGVVERELQPPLAAAAEAAEPAPAAASAAEAAPTARTAGSARTLAARSPGCRRCAGRALSGLARSRRRAAGRGLAATLATRSAAATAAEEAAETARGRLLGLADRGREIDSP